MGATLKQGAWLDCCGGTHGDTAFTGGPLSWCFGSALLVDEIAIIHVASSLYYFAVRWEGPSGAVLLANY